MQFTLARSGSDRPSAAQFVLKDRDYAGLQRTMARLDADHAARERHPTFRNSADPISSIT